MRTTKNTSHTAVILRTYKGELFATRTLEDSRVVQEIVHKVEHAFELVQSCGLFSLHCFHAHLFCFIDRFHWLATLSNYSGVFKLLKRSSRRRVIFHASWCQYWPSVLFSDGEKLVVPSWRKLNRIPWRLNYSEKGLLEIFRARTVKSGKWIACTVFLLLLWSQPVYFGLTWNVDVISVILL